MKISLKSIWLENFKGIKSSAIDFDKHSLNIYGDNATGKTTHLDGFLWCLFNKDSQNSTAFEIKALDTTGKATHNLDHSVSVILDIDGTALALKKVLTEKWTRKRGEKAKQFTGHTTTYFIDEVPVKKKDFDARITSTIDEGVFRLLTDARYFCEVMSWKDRRDLLVTVCGDVSIADIISTDAKLASVPEILKGQSPDDAKKRLNIQRKTINDEITAIPVRVDEATRSIVELSMLAKDAEDGLKDLGTERVGFEKEMSALANGGETPKLQVEIQGLRAEIQKQENDFEAGKKVKAEEAWDSIQTIEGEISKASKTQSQLDIDLHRNAIGVKNVNQDMTNLRLDWHDVDSMAFDGSDICPTCGQALPAGQVETAIGKFNASKATMLKEINSKGKELKLTLEGLNVAKKTMEDGIVRGNASISELTSKLVPLKIEIETIKADKVDVSQLTTKIGELGKRIEDADTGEGQEELSRITLQLKNNASEADLRKAVIAQALANSITQKRIDELTGHEERLVGELTGIEKQLFIIDKFTRVRVDLLESKINTKFQIARFKMFSEQINGGLMDICETVLDGVPYGSINSAGRVQVGFDIIKTLQAHYGVTVPVWCDNRESIVQLPEMESQVISLIVSAQDKELRIETVENKQEVVA